MKRSILSMAIALAAITPTSVLAAETVTEKNAEQPMEKIEVTGSRIKRADFEGVAPVTVISADEIAN